MLVETAGQRSFVAVSSSSLQRREITAKRRSSFLSRLPLPPRLNVNNVRQPKPRRDVCRRGNSRHLLIARTVRHWSTGIKTSMLRTCVRIHAVQAESILFSAGWSQLPRLNLENCWTGVVLAVSTCVWMSDRRSWMHGWRRRRRLSIASFWMTPGWWSTSTTWTASSKVMWLSCSWSTWIANSRTSYLADAASVSSCSLLYGHFETPQVNDSVSYLFFHCDRFSDWVWCIKVSYQRIRKRIYVGLLDNQSVS